MSGIIGSCVYIASLSGICLVVRNLEQDTNSDCEQSRIMALT